MRLEFTDEEQAFREEVRSFLREQLSPEVSQKVLNGYELGREEIVDWQRRLHERGWGAMSWPVQFGGPGWTSVQQYIFEEEAALAGAPRWGPLQKRRRNDGRRTRNPAAPRDRPPTRPERVLPPRRQASAGEARFRSRSEV